MKNAILCLGILASPVLAQPQQPWLLPWPSVGNCQNCSPPCFNLTEDFWASVPPIHRNQGSALLLYLTTLHLSIDQFAQPECGIEAIDAMIGVAEDGDSLTGTHARLFLHIGADCAGKNYYRSSTAPYMYADQDYMNPPAGWTCKSIIRQDHLVCTGANNGVVLNFTVAQDGVTATGGASFGEGASLGLAGQANIGHVPSNELFEAPVQRDIQASLFELKTNTGTAYIHGIADGWHAGIAAQIGWVNADQDRANHNDPFEVRCPCGPGHKRCGTPSRPVTGLPPTPPNPGGITPPHNPNGGAPRNTGFPGTGWAFPPGYDPRRDPLHLPFPNGLPHPALQFN